jgi:UDP-N-acetyl-D-mannosaminuronic acid dehydrogenase
MNIDSLLEQVRLKKARIAVLGLGHVGLPTALVFASSGFKVTGIDTDGDKVEALKRGECYIQEPSLQRLLTECLTQGMFDATVDPNAIEESDFVSICVPTPVQDGTPDLRNFNAAMDTVESRIHRGSTILIESTIPPTTTRELVLPRLERLGYEIDEEIFLAFCPERLSPGQALQEFANSTRTIGAIGPKSGHISSELYKTVCKDVRLTDALTAELAKTAENTFRDLNIAYANLLALISEQAGADVNDVIRLANTHPRVRIHTPSLGVGGPCLPKDPYLLVQNVPKHLSQLILSARELNDSMVDHAVDLLSRTLEQNSVELRNAKVSVLGVTYKPESEDTTNSVAKHLIERLLKAGASVTAYDPFTNNTFGAKKASNLDEALQDADSVIIVTAHAEFSSLDPRRISELAKRHCVIFDGPRCLDPKECWDHALIYLGTGFGVKNRPPQFVTKSDDTN